MLMPQENKQTGQRRCFVISPIGEENSPVRVRSDDVLDFIIRPALEKCGYEVPPLRADQLPSPGRITRQIIDQLLRADLVADLTDHNPNVFYELAIRHASRKPVVQIIHAKDKLPFDVANQPTIFYDHQSLRSANRAVEELARQIRAVEENPEDVDTPLTEALLIDSLSQSSDPVARSNAEIMAALQEIRGQVASLGQMSEASIRALPLYDAHLREPSSEAERLLAEFNQILRIEGRPDFSLLEQCPPNERKELLSLMNFAALAHRELSPEREAFRARRAKAAS